MHPLIQPTIKPIQAIFGLVIVKIPYEPYKVELMPSQRCSPNCASKFGFAYHGFMSNQSYLEGYMHNGSSINHETGFGAFMAPLPCFCESFHKNIAPHIREFPMAIPSRELVLYIRGSWFKSISCHFFSSFSIGTNIVFITEKAQSSDPHVKVRILRRSFN